MSKIEITPTAHDFESYYAAAKLVTDGKKDETRIYALHLYSDGTDLYSTNTRALVKIMQTHHPRGFYRVLQATRKGVIALLDESLDDREYPDTENLTDLTDYKSKSFQLSEDTDLDALQLSAFKLTGCAVRQSLLKRFDRVFRFSTDMFYRQDANYGPLKFVQGDTVVVVMGFYLGGAWDNWGE